MSPRSLLGLALAAVLAIPAAHAQLVPSVDFGVAGGVNFASLGNAGGLNLDQSTGFNAGVYADVGVLFFAARTGLFYVSAGDIPGQGQNGENGTVRFISVPVDFQFQTPTPLVKAYALVGPEFRFPLSGLDTFDKSGLSTAVDVGVGAKGGVPLIGPSGFIELRYARDLTGFGSLQSSTTGDDVKVHLFLVRAGIGL